jgi:hypothetical protein
MEYNLIPQHIRQFISRTVYTRSSPEVKEMMIEIGNELHIQFKEYPYMVDEQGALHPFAVENEVKIKFYAVGMRYYGDHIFTMDDDIHLEKEDDNPHDSNAIKVMVDGVHKAYVSKLENKSLRCVKDFEHKKVKLITNHATCSVMNLMVF